MNFSLTLTNKIAFSFVLILMVFKFSLSAQYQELDHEDYGFQINVLSIPKLAPYGYESVLTVKMNNPLYANQKYEVGFWIGGKQLRNEGYSYPIVVFPSNFMGRVEQNIFDLVESFDIMPSLKLNPKPSLAVKDHFRFTIQPDTTYNYVTIALKNYDWGQAPINFQKDVKVTGVFVRPLKDSIPFSEADKKIVKFQTKSIPEILAERTLMDSKKSYVVSDPIINIGLFDHRNIDKDIVTIYLNQKIIIENLQLKRKKQFYEIQLNPGKNTITLHAENLGEVAPNTAAILIKSKSKEFMAVLESDLGQSEFFTIVYQPE